MESSGLGTKRALAVHAPAASGLTHLAGSEAELLDAVMQASYDGICLVSPDGHFIEMNQAFERVTGLRRADWLGRTIQEMRATPGMAKTSAALQVADGSAPATTLVHLADGQLLLVTASPHFDKTDQLASIILNVRNITQLNDLKRQLEKRRGEATLEAFDRSHLHQQLMAIGLDDFVVQSPPMMELVSTVVQVADFDLTVLVEGETGVGKGVMAKLIHRLSRRADKPLVEVNCGAIPESLVESELFGYEPGAFTGSNRSGKQGFFEAAQGGTIFLDEVGELPLGSQAKLLKILDDRLLVRVGGTRPHRLDVRVIAATNRRLRDLVRQGLFRADLLYRLETIPLPIPPLRERPEDLRSLIYSFVERFNGELDCDRVMTEEAVDLLASHPLPGNVRELKNIVVRLVLGGRGKTIGADDVRGELEPGAGGDGAAAPGSRSLKDQVEELERRVLTEQCDRARSTYEVAKRLGMNQSSVVRKMKKYGIPSIRSL